MDIQRIAILLGLGITSYLLMLAWNEDYGSRKVDESVITTHDVPGIQEELPEIVVVSESEDTVPVI